VAPTTTAALTTTAAPTLVQAASVHPVVTTPARATAETAETPTPTVPRETPRVDLEATPVLIHTARATLGQTHTEARTPRAASEATPVLIHTARATRAPIHMEARTPRAGLAATPVLIPTARPTRHLPTPTVAPTRARGATEEAAETPIPMALETKLAHQTPMDRAVTAVVITRRMTARLASCWRRLAALSRTITSSRRALRRGEMLGMMIIRPEVTTTTTIDWLWWDGNAMDDMIV